MTESNLGDIRPDMDVNAITNEKTPLAFAAASGLSSRTQKLLEAKAEVNAACVGGTALAFAADAGHVDCVKVLVETKADVSAAARSRNSLITDVYGTTFYVVHSPASQDMEEIVRFLLDANANAFSLSSVGQNLMFLGIQAGSQPLIEQFVAAKLDINLRTKKNLVGCPKGQYPLGFATWLKYIEPGGMQESFMASKSNVTFEMYGIATVVGMTAVTNNAWGSEYFADEYKCNIYKQGMLGVTLLHWSVLFDTFENARFLLDRRIDTRLKFLGKNGFTLAESLQRSHLADLISEFQ
jgi:ankyrin repeat protein